MFSIRGFGFPRKTGPQTLNSKRRPALPHRTSPEALEIPEMLQAGLVGGGSGFRKSRCSGFREKGFRLGASGLLKQILITSCYKYEAHLPERS